MKPAVAKKDDQAEGVSERTYTDSGAKAVPSGVHHTTPDESQFGPRRDTSRLTILQRNDNSSVSQFYHQNALSIGMSQDNQQKLSIPKQTSAGQLSPIPRSQGSDERHLHDHEIFRSRTGNNPSRRDDTSSEQNVTLNTQLGEQRAPGQPTKYQNQKRPVNEELSSSSNLPFKEASGREAMNLDTPFAHLTSDVSSATPLPHAPQPSMMNQEQLDQYNQYMMMFEFNQKLGQNTSAYMPQQSDKSDIRENGLIGAAFGAADNYQTQLRQDLSAGTSNRSSANLRKTKNSEVNFGSMKNHSLFPLAQNQYNLTSEHGLAHGTGTNPAQTEEDYALEPSASVATSQDHPPAKPPLVRMYAPKQVPGDDERDDPGREKRQPTEQVGATRRSLRRRRSPKRRSSRQANGQADGLQKQIGLSPLLLERENAALQKGDDSGSASQSVSPMTPMSLSPRSNQKSHSRRAKGASIVKPTTHTLFRKHNKEKRPKATAESGNGRPGPAVTAAPSHHASAQKRPPDQSQLPAPISPFKIVKRA